MGTRSIWLESDSLRVLLPYLVFYRDILFCPETSIMDRVVQSLSAEAKSLRNLGYLTRGIWKPRSAGYDAALD